MRKRLVGASLVLALLLAVGVARLGSQTQCGGSFLPSLNCLISGYWNFTNATSAQGELPFKANGTPVTGIVSKVTDLTNAQVLALNSTPITVVPAPGAGYYVDVITVDLIFNYTGAYTVGSGDDLRLYYASRTGGNAASASIETTGFLDATADRIISVAGVPDNTNPPTTNVVVALQGVSNTAFGGGNASNTLRVVVNYRIVTTGL